MNKNYKIVVVGLGYVGLSNAVLLAQHNDVIGVDLSHERVNAVNARRSPIIDKELSEYLAEKHLNLSASTNLQSSLKGADYVVVSTPTNYDEKTDFFDTSSVEAVISDVIEYEPGACIIVKSTIPIGFVDNICKRLNTTAIIFSPEFLREGRALFDNLYPSRIIMGEKSNRAEVFAQLLAQGALKANIDMIFTTTYEAEAIKLFSNTYLAMRVAFFNEVDTFASIKSLDSKEIIDGICLDERIGQHYNNPSFGYGGYCLPKDTKQLLSNFDSIPQDLFTAIVNSNTTRKKFIASKVLSHKPNVIGVYRLTMKKGSDNYRESAILDVIDLLKVDQKTIIIYEPKLKLDNFQGVEFITDLEEFKKTSDVILANRIDDEIIDVIEKTISADVYGEN